MRKTTLKKTPKNHAADVIADAQVHADAIARDEAAVKAEDAAFEARGKAVDAAESEKRKSTDEAKRKAAEQFASVCECIGRRGEIVRAIRRHTFARSAEYHSLIAQMEYLGHDPELVNIVLATAPEFTIEGGYVRERRITERR